MKQPTPRERAQTLAHLADCLVLLDRPIPRAEQRQAAADLGLEWMLPDPQVDLFAGAGR